MSAEPHQLPPTPDAFTRWAQQNAIPQEYWYLCRQAWEAGAQDMMRAFRQLTNDFGLTHTARRRVDAVATNGCKATVASRLDT